jgi:hypothetical protein
MTPRWAGLTAPFRWLIDAVDVGRHQPAVIISAILFTVAVGFLPSLPIQLLTLAGSPPGMAVQLLFQAIGLIVTLAISPVLVAGIYRLLDGAEQGRPVAVAQIGDGFRDGSWGAIVLVTVLGYVLMFGLLLVLGLLLWFGYRINPAWWPQVVVGAGWMHAKLSLVALLFAYYIVTARLMKRVQSGGALPSSTALRWFNELPIFLALGAIWLVIAKPF